MAARNPIMTLIFHDPTTEAAALHHTCMELIVLLLHRFGPKRFCSLDKYVRYWRRIIFKAKIGNIHTGIGRTTNTDKIVHYDLVVTSRHLGTYSYVCTYDYVHIVHARACNKARAHPLVLNHIACSRFHPINTPLSSNICAVLAASTR
jgi:hypothetical protein